MTAIGKPRGVLRGAPGDGSFAHDRHAPPPDLAAFVEHFWTVAWRVTGAPVTREVLSHPSVHLVLERGRSAVTGVPRGRFVRELAGEGEVFGIKFRPGGFRPLAPGPIAQLTDRTVPLGELLPAAADLEDRVLSAPAIDDRIAIAAGFLRGVLPTRDAAVDHVAALVKRVLDDRDIRKVDDVARIAGTSPRALQRLFSEYVGVSPKWVIRRFRLHDAIERMDAGGVVDWPSLALDLGYFDQAHFIRDFKSLVGRTPGDYGALAATSSSLRASPRAPRAPRRRSARRAAPSTASPRSPRGK